MGRFGREIKHKDRVKKGKISHFYFRKREITFFSLFFLFFFFSLFINTMLLCLMRKSERNCFSMTVNDDRFVYVTKSLWSNRIVLGNWNYDISSLHWSDIHISEGCLLNCLEHNTNAIPLHCFYLWFVAAILKIIQLNSVVDWVVITGDILISTAIAPNYKGGNTAHTHTHRESVGTIMKKKKCTWYRDKQSGCHIIKVKWFICSNAWKKSPDWTTIPFGSIQWTRTSTWSNKFCT